MTADILFSPFEINGLTLPNRIVMAPMKRNMSESGAPYVPQGLNCTGWAKKLTGAATISVGSVGLQSDFMGAFGGQGVC